MLVCKPYAINPNRPNNVVEVNYVESAGHLFMAVMLIITFFNFYTVYTISVCVASSAGSKFSYR